MNDRLLPGDNSLDPGIGSRAHNGEVMAFGNLNGGLRSGDLAHAAGVSPDTLRHYERLGILKKPPRTSNGYRVYSHDALDRVLLIQNALAVGFSLRELTSILSVRDRGGAPCRQVVELAAEKVLKLDEQIAQLTRLRKSLKEKVKEWNRLVDRVPKNGRVGLLESLGRDINQNSTNERGAADEAGTGFLRVSDSGSCLRAKRNLVPNAQSKREGR
jgi:DNA-binding transcriptional MerR regulator